MGLFRSGKYDLNKDIATTREQLRRIELLAELTKHPAWRDVDALFRKITGTFTDEMYALCDDPVKNAFEIRCKFMVIQALSSLLGAINGKVESREQLRDNLDDKIQSQKNLVQPVL